MADDTLAEVLAAGGWAYVGLELGGVTDKPGFMERCVRAFELPEYFGRNWDALADCLTDLSWAPPVRGRLVEVTGWQEYAGAEPDDWNIAREVFAQAVDHWDGTGTELRIALALGGSS
ncbi:barstar family protein [Streptomyces sp. NPDC001868]|uniref:barstar family protein n=1 Tax=Streptomyces sp. NPDC001868 TaxID=3154401 RepID=UPI003332F54B